ncbi:hypothetical protein MNBD_GAMMA21-53 [hydrothermal vent metagenome]|uniref:Uncharacterized protein n=1 Tax=hydrothermal vent metagenome TaxID=652676 RepID=A0A3B0ZT36_9ZZZZ
MPISKHNSLLYLKLAIPVFFLFAIVYGGTNWFSSTREEYYHIYFNWELSIPFVAEMIIIYLSIQLIFILPIFHCQETNMYILAKRMSLATILAGIIFILLPTHFQIFLIKKLDTT